LPAASREYELVLMLDPEMPEERREQIASEARRRIESGGALKHDTAWGMRKLAYEIRQRTEADYRYFRFETDGALLDELNHNLRIADGVLRFRIFKVDAGSPAIVPPAPLAGTAPPRGGRRQAPRAASAAPAAAEAGEGGEAEGPAEASEGDAEEVAEEGPQPEGGEPVAEPSEDEAQGSGSEGGSEQEPAG
jgi:small subunit ribosomal protein S6